MTSTQDEQLRKAIRATEYKYFGDYEMSDNQREAVEVLVDHAKASLCALPAPDTAGSGLKQLRDISETQSAFDVLAARQQPLGAEYAAAIADRDALYDTEPQAPATGEVQAIIAWLRAEDKARPHDSYMGWIANRIERGEHISADTEVTNK